MIGREALDRIKMSSTYRNQWMVKNSEKWGRIETSVCCITSSARVLDRREPIGALTEELVVEGEVVVV